MIDEKFHKWIREKGTDKDRDLLRGSGLPQPRDKGQTDSAWSRYCKATKQ